MVDPSVIARPQSFTTEAMTGNALLALFMTLFILIDGRTMWTWIVRLFPTRSRAAIMGAGEAGWITLSTFVRVQIFVAFVVVVTIISPPAHETGNESLKPYVAAVRELAVEHKTLLVPLHDVFLDAAKARPDIDWATDGVHPTSSGHMLIARQWLNATELL